MISEYIKGHNKDGVTEVKAWGSRQQSLIDNSLANVMRIKVNGDWNAKFLESHNRIRFKNYTEDFFFF